MEKLNLWKPDGAWGRGSVEVLGWNIERKYSVVVFRAKFRNIQ